MSTNKKYDIVCFGIMLNDVLVKGVRDDIMEFEADVADSVSLCTGGDALNEAVTCAHLGLKTVLAGVLGDDLFGNIVLDSVKKEGVSTEGIEMIPGTRTAVNIVLVGKHGNRSILTTLNNNVDSTCLTEKALSVIKESKAVCIGSLFVNESMHAELVQKIYSTAKEAGVITIADATFSDPEGKRFSDKISCLKGLDYFFPSYDEGKILTGKTEPEAIVKELLQYVNKAVVLKMGEQGCLVGSHEEEIFHVPIFKVQTVDTTGAGDNFVAGFIWALNQKRPLKECCRRAAAVGAIATTGIGANGVVKSAGQIEEFLSKAEKQAGF